MDRDTLPGAVRKSLPTPHAASATVAVIAPHRTRKILRLKSSFVDNAAKDLCRVARAEWDWGIGIFLRVGLLLDQNPVRRDSGDHTQATIFWNWLELVNSMGPFASDQWAGIASSMPFIAPVPSAGFAYDWPVRSRAGTVRTSTWVDAFGHLKRTTRHGVWALS